MAEQQVTASAEHQQVAGVELQVGSDVEWNDVVGLERPGAAAGLAGRIGLQAGLAKGPPSWRSFGARRRLALDAIEKGLNHRGHRMAIQ